MPEVTTIRCSNCGVAFPSGWGGHAYALAADGSRVVCPHPGEARHSEKITGMKWPEARAAGRVGFISYCMCFSCGNQFELDLDRDLKACPSCASMDFRTANGALGSECPRCHNGLFHERGTGLYA